jgi:hypothetical protein
MLNAMILNVFMLDVIMLNIFLLSVVMMSDTMLSFVTNKFRSATFIAKIKMMQKYVIWNKGFQTTVVLEFG